MNWGRIPRADRVLILALVIIAGLGALLAWRFGPREQRGGFADQPSTLHNDADGAKATYLVLRRLDQRITRLRQPILDRTLKPLAGLFILRPIRPLKDEQEERLLAWVRAGHRLVLAPRYGAPGNLSDWFRYAKDEKGNNDEDQEAEPAGEHPNKRSTRTDSSPNEPPEDRPIKRVAAHAGQELADDPLFSNITRIESRPGPRFDAEQPLEPTGSLAGATVEPLWREGNQLAAMRIQLGEGRIIVLADVYPMTNAGLREADNALLAANLASFLAGGRTPGRVAFDEYHHGYPDLAPQAIGIARLLAGQGRIWGLAQAGLAAGLALFGAAVRFGRPLPLPERRRRRQGEFAEAAGQLLQRAGGSAKALATLYDHYRRRLCRLTHLHVGADDRLLAERVRARTGLELAGPLAAGQAARHGERPDPERMLRSVGALHRAMERLEHATG